MSLILFVIGAIALMLGLGMAAYGIPINEFSFGNTLIIAGITAASGGLIVIALAAVVRELQRLGEGPSARAPAHPLSPVAAEAPPPRMPSPPKPRAEPRPQAPLREAPPPEPRPLTSAELEALHPGQSFAPAFAPTLRNPEAPAMTVEDEVSLSPLHSGAAPARQAPPPAGETYPEQRLESAFEPPWHAPPPPRETRGSNFDAMWPAEPKPRGDLPPLGRPERAPPPREQAPRPAPADMPAAPSRNVAILKSGVVDGMAYTLYVDGSIEAELPQGTLHFASIDELRAHLEGGG